MLTRLSLFAWLVSLEAVDADATRQDALRGGFELAQRAVTEGLVDAGTQAHGQVARAMAELEADGWVVWDWIRYGGDPRSEQPPATMFDDQSLERVQNVRITPEGYAAFSARQGLSASSDTDRDGDAPPTTPRATTVLTARYDLFISHASEDKAEVARPLAQALGGLGFSVWYDEEQIELGSSLRMNIEAGLAASRYGVVVLSKAFFAKAWPQQELNGLFAREVAGEDVILPLWHGISADYVRARAPMLADRFALDTSIGTTHLADRLSRRLRRERGREDLRVRAVVQAPTMPPPPAKGARIDQPAVVSEGDDGVAIRERTIAMLRAGDDVGLRELLRYEQRTFEGDVTTVLQEAGDRLGSSAEPAALQPIERALWAATERRLGSLLPLVEYRPDALADELTALVAMAGRPTPTRAPYAAWLDGPRWPVWLVTLILGTVSVALDRPDVALAIWERRAPYSKDRPLPAARLGGAADLGGALLRARPASASPPIELWYPAFAVWDSKLLRDHYPEIMSGGDTADAVLGFLSRAGDFLWLCGALAGRDRVEMIRFWAASQVHPALPARLDRESDLVQTYAAALGVRPDELLTSMRTWHDRVNGPVV